MAVTWKKLAYETDVLLKSLLTTKGDLLTYSTLAARLGIGTDTHVLTADSGEDAGIKWAAAAGNGGATVATGSYVGTGAARQVTTGFKCSFAVIILFYEEYIYLYLLIPNATFELFNTTISNRTAVVYLHAADGLYFAAAHANAAGLTYYYWAISE